MCCFCALTCRDKLQPQSRVPLRDLQKSTSTSRPAPAAAAVTAATAPTSGLALHQQSDILSNLTFAPEKGLFPAAAAAAAATDPHDSSSLADVTVPLEVISPSKRRLLRPRRWTWNNPPLTCPRPVVSFRQPAPGDGV